MILINFWPYDASFKSTTSDNVIQNDRGNIMNYQTHSRIFQPGALSHL